MVKESSISKKLRGGYYTPKIIADFIVKWAIKNKQDIVLEPSCGDGVFIESIIKQYKAFDTSNKDIISNIKAVEFYQTEATKALNRFISHDIPIIEDQIIIGDFFRYCKDKLINKTSFDCVIGNPPFIRYQDFPEEQRLPAFELMTQAGLKPSRLTNAWIPFLIAATLLLKKGGRLGMVIPAELFQVNYAAQTRAFLSEQYSKVNIITFRKLVFEGIQQEVVLLLAEKNGKEEHGINVIELTDVGDLENFDFSNFKNDIKLLNHSTEKWIQYYLTNKEINLLRSIKTNLPVSFTGDYMEVDVGIVTGQNKFFVLSEEEIEKRQLRKYTHKIIGRANHLKGIVLSENDWLELIKHNYPNFLLYISNSNYNDLPENVRGYIDFGIEQQYHDGYKCRIRKRWWEVPSVWTPDAFLLRQVHQYPKLVLNNCRATATDTLHRVKFKNEAQKELLTVAFLNSLTFAFSEVTGRSYGGGVLTFEPSEAERLPIPMNNAESLSIGQIDKLLRTKGIEAVLDVTDNILLRKGLGLSDNDIKLLKNIWKKLSNRRINRK